MRSVSVLCVEVFSDISPTQLWQVIEAMNHVEKLKEQHEGYIYKPATERDEITICRT